MPLDQNAQTSEGRLRKIPCRPGIFREFLQSRRPSAPDADYRNSKHRMTFDRSAQAAEGILQLFPSLPSGEGQGEWVLVQCAALERFDPERAPTHPSPLRGADLSPEGEEVKQSQESLL